MKSILDEHRPLTGDRQTSAAQIFPNVNTAARASTVNRTHRVVRERAKLMAARRSRVRSLWIPLTICSALLFMIFSAVWTVLDGYDLTPMWMPDSSDQFLMLFLWFLPLSMALLVMVWFRRARVHSSGEAAR